MIQRQQLLKRLLTTFHLDTVQRDEFRNTPIHLEEIISIIDNAFKYKKFFPESASIWTAGEPVFEGFFIERTGKDNYKLHWQRHHANNPFQLAEKKEQIYDSLNKVIDDYIKLEFDYTIDGIKILRDD